MFIQYSMQMFYSYMYLATHVTALSKVRLLERDDVFIFIFGCVEKS